MGEYKTKELLKQVFDYLKFINPLITIKSGSQEVQSEKNNTSPMSQLDKKSSSHFLNSN